MKALEIPKTIHILAKAVTTSITLALGSQTHESAHDFQLKQEALNLLRDADSTKI